ncbi:hypothetical protein [Alteromonas sp. C1M14]|uniref:hypothetical protein n=1 Tax=Alteromonas sp. C1M14 TaxID=2841567 RepID=UPI001C087823|nr:hypothetical protein [Alteromonas sp. C1M14]MBU2976840.1 hypothetical protein [Alteromonas sp. C1M14]
MKTIQIQKKANYQSSVSTIIAGCEEVLNQGLVFLNNLSEKDYTALCSPHFESSIGEHFRHWLDLFHSLERAEDKIDYNLRRRGHKVERDIEIAKREIDSLLIWLTTLNETTLDASIKVELETLVSLTSINEVTSTLGRELSFVALHATHHFAMVKLAASLMGVKASGNFGVAPSTASFRRAQ